MSIWNRIFHKTPLEASPTFINPIKVELHSHLIPGIDDGVQTMEESIDVLRRFSQLGYDKVITTPHIMGDGYKNGKFNILPALEEIRLKLKENHIHIQIEAAAEYMVDDMLQSKIDKRELLSFGDNYVLIEMPFTEPSPNFQDIVFSMRINGYNPVLAHPERYMYYGLNLSKLDALWETEMLFQININSLIGYYSPQIQQTAEYLIDRKMVSMVGSDTHGMRHLPALEHALKSRNYERVCALPLLNNQL